MRQLARELRTVWFASYDGKTEILDEDGRRTGEFAISYSKPFPVKGTLSPENGNTWGDGFGVGVDMDRTFISAKTGLGIDVNCVAWVGSAPSMNGDGSLKTNADGDMDTANDYTVSMVAESYSITNVALKKAN